MLQQNPEFQKKFASKAEKVNLSESKHVPEKTKTPEKIPKRDMMSPEEKLLLGPRGRSSQSKTLLIIKMSGV